MKRKEFFQKVSCEFLRALRGERSQAQINKKMAINYNIISHWESGQKYIRWDDFLLFCKANQVSTKKLIKLYFPQARSANDLQNILKLLLTQEELAEASKRMGRSPRTLKKYLNQTQVPPLYEILDLISHRGFLIRFLRSFDLAKELPTLQNEIEQHKKTIQLFSKFPEVSPLLLSLELSPYKNGSLNIQHICEKLKMSRDHFSHLVDRLEGIGLLKQQDGFYQPTNNYLNLNWGELSETSAAEKIKSHWIRRSYLIAKDHPQQLDQAEFEVFACDDELYSQILLETKKFRQRLHRILEDYEEGDWSRVVLLNLNVFDLLTTTNE